MLIYGVELGDMIQIGIGFLYLISSIVSIIALFKSAQAVKQNQEVIEQNKRSYEKEYEYQSKKFATEIAQNCADFYTKEVSIILEPFLRCDELNNLSNLITNDGEKVFFSYHDLNTRISEIGLNKLKLSNTDELYNYEKNLIHSYFKNNEDVCYKYDSLIIYVLNKMEYIAMCISSNIANDDIVYPSLHQLFLRTTQHLSVVICSRNRNSLDNYYPYMIKLFKDWNRRVREEKVASKSIETISENTKKSAFTK